MNHSYYSKKLLLCAFVLCTLSGFAQIPNGYYDGAAGLTGDPLKNSLHTIIDGHIEFPYTSTNTDVWDILKETDRDPNNPNNVIGIYSGFSMNAALEYDGGLGWNREHVWAKSRGDFGTTLGPGTDVHHLRAADVSTNSARNNRNFDNCTTPYTDGSGNYSGPTESFTSSSEWVWQPPASVKGDVARMIFYMTVRYEGTNGEPDLELTDVLLTNTDKTPFHAKMTTLLQWHNEDPVDDAERTRNDVVYSFQQNRNPFIDHPEYVCQIWSCATGNSAPAFTSSPVTTGIEDQAYTYNVTASDANGDPLTMAATTLPTWLSFVDNGNGTAALSGTPVAANVGTNSVALTVSDGIAGPVTQSFTITVSAAGGGGGGSATELFFSEYIEGSSYNKGLEIANFTGASVNLSGYSIFKQANGSGSWGSELALSGTIANGDVYVIVHTSANASMQAVADLTTGSGSMTFNGNDPVALFKSGTQIDVIGNFNSTANYAQNQTMVRNSSVSSPNTSYTTGEWTVFGTDTSTDLGTHTFDGGTPPPPPPTCDVPTGLNSSSVTETSATISWSTASGADSYNVQYRVTGAGTWTSTTSSTTSKSLSGLTASTTYEFQVSSQCGASASAYSSVASFTTLTPAPTCDVPTGLSSSSITETSATISWSSATGADSYNVQYRETGAGTWTNTTSTVTNKSLSGLTASTSYEFQISSQCGATASAYSSVASFTTSTPSPTCDVPTGLTASGITTTSASLSWSATSAANYGVRYRVSGTSTWTDVNSTPNSLSLSGLSSSTNYESQVRSQCGATSSTYSSSIFFTTASASVSYCTSSGNNGTEEWIDRFVVNSIDNSSGMNNGYADFTAMSTTLNAGSNYSFTIYPEWSGRAYNEAYNIWIDFNQDGDFTDSGEDVYSISKNKFTSISGSITIPTSALSGATRMRVTLKYNSNASSCETFSYGEVEDYTINISGGASARKGSTTASNATKINVENSVNTMYPNPANDVLNVMVEAREFAHLQIMSVTGKVVFDSYYGETGEIRINVGHFEKGIYILTVENRGGKLTHRVVIK